MHQILLIIFSFLTLNLLFSQFLQAVSICSSFSCNKHKDDPIQFPFRVPGNQTSRCGYPGFELSCNSHDQTFLSISSKSYIVEGISYSDQLLWVSDPNRCIPKQIIDSINLSTTPFSYRPLESPHTFLTCFGKSDKLPAGVAEISCLSNRNKTVLMALDDRAAEKMLKEEKEWKCEVLKRVNAAFLWQGMEYGLYPNDMSDMFLQLSWDIPSCGDCTVRGGNCGLVGDYGLEVACYLPSSGFPKSAKYGLILGAGIPGLLCIIGLTLFITSRVSARNRNRRYTNTESSPSIFPTPIILTMGLDQPTIESYPKTILGESKRLPKPSDSTCPICLSEYQPNETLRSIPDCNHYFHADCIDEWLRMNATCPLCRNSPQPSSGLPDC
ncbi:unnamed protein product [Amaranthus hypochondriacus]